MRGHSWHHHPSAQNTAGIDHHRLSSGNVSSWTASVNSELRSGGPKGKLARPPPAASDVVRCICAHFHRSHTHARGILAPPPWNIAAAHTARVMAAAEASAAALASSVGRLAASKHVSEHEQTWRLEGLTLASFTGAAVGDKLHSPPFQACGLAWRLSLAPNGSKAEAKDHVGVCCELLSPDATAQTSQAVTFAVGGSELGTFGARGGSAFSTCAVRPQGAVPYWGPGLTLSHAQLAADPEKHLPGVLTVRAVLRFDASEERTNPSVLLARALGADFGALLESGEHTDVTLVCGEERLAAHALVLRARSPVFAAQLADGPLRADADAVPVPPEITPHTLRRLLHFLYTDELEPESAEEASHLLNAADSYDVRRLFAICERTLNDALSVDNAAATLTLADQHSALALKNAALRFVAANTLAVMATAGWAQLLVARPLLMADAMHTMAAGEPPAPRAAAAQAGTSAP